MNPFDFATLWNGDVPFDEGRIKSELDGLRTQVARAAKDVVASPTADRAVPATNLAFKLQEQLKSVEREIRKSTDVVEKHHKTDLTKTALGRNYLEQLRGLAELLQLWRSTVLAAAAGTTENARAKFNDAGAWARHYSTVRMTVSTFFIGLSWGIISFKWNDYSPELSRTAAAVWGLAGVLLLIFTILTASKSSNQAKNRALLPTGATTAPRTALSFAAQTGIWLPVALYAAASWGFYAYLLEAWKAHKPGTTVTWSAIIENLPPSEDEAAAPRAVDFSAWMSAIERMTTAMEQLQAQRAVSDASAFGDEDDRTAQPGDSNVPPR